MCTWQKSTKLNRISFGEAQLYVFRLSDLLAMCGNPKHEYHRVHIHVIDSCAAIDNDLRASCSMVFWRIGIRLGDLCMRKDYYCSVRDQICKA